MQQVWSERKRRNSWVSILKIFLPLPPCGPNKPNIIWRPSWCSTYVNSKILYSQSKPLDSILLLLFCFNLKTNKKSSMPERERERCVTLVITDEPPALPNLSALFFNVTSSSPCGACHMIVTWLDLPWVPLFSCQVPNTRQHQTYKHLAAKLKVSITIPLCSGQFFGS